MRGRVSFPVRWEFWSVPVAPPAGCSLEASGDILPCGVNCRRASSAIDSHRSSDSLRSPTTVRLLLCPREKILSGKI